MNDKFVKEILELLEVEKINIDDRLEKFENWDSFTHLSVIAFFDSEYNIILTNDDLKKINTIGDLWRLTSHNG